MSNGCELIVLMPLYIAGSFLHFDSGSESINIYLLAFPNFAKVLTEPVVSLLQGINPVRVICSKVKDTTTSFAIILNYL